MLCNTTGVLCTLGTDVSMASSDKTHLCQLLIMSNVSMNVVCDAPECKVTCTDEGGPPRLVLWVHLNGLELVSNSLLEAVGAAGVGWGGVDRAAATHRQPATSDSGSEAAIISQA